MPIVGMIYARLRCDIGEAYRKMRMTDLVLTVGACKTIVATSGVCTVVTGKCRMRALNSGWFEIQGSLSRPQ
jgi:hypothetical protein